MTAKLNNDMNTFVFRNGLPISLFESNDEPDAEAVADFSSLRNPLVDVACKIEDLFADDVNAAPTLAQVAPLARRLISLTANATQATANVRQSLINWLDASKQNGRAWNIKMATKQLAKMVLDQPSLDTAVNDDDLPF